MPIIDPRTGKKIVRIFDPRTGKDVKKILARNADGSWSTVWQKEAGEYFKFTIDTRQTNTEAVTTSNTFRIPTSNAFAYNWRINWGDGNTETASGTGSSGSSGILHTYAAPGIYQITIAPAGQVDAWFRAFGCSTAWNYANDTANKNKLLSLDSKLTPLMFLTTDEVSTGVSTSTGILHSCFYECKGIGFAMGDDFTFSEAWNNITKVGSYFCYYTWLRCTGNAFTMSPDFQLPQKIKSVGDNSFSSMFDGCTGAAFQVNEVFKFPAVNVNSYGVLGGVFKSVTAMQSRTAISIIGANAAPSSAKGTFSTAFPDYASLPANWRQ